MKLLLPGLLLAVTALAACGSSDPEPTPTACLDGQGPYLAALERSPERTALLDGEVPISECLVADQPAGALNGVGAAVVAAATKLNEQARDEPRGEETARLGYLVGAVERGAEDTAGIHTDLVRRLNSAARFSEGETVPGAAFERTFGAGYAVGRESG